MASTEQNAIANRMKRRHAEYSRLRPTYDFLRAAYMGGDAYLSKNLFQLEPRESKADYDRRLKRAVYPNYVRPVIRTYRSHIFRHEDGITRPDGTPAYQDWLKNVNRRGTDANAFWGNVISREMLYGWTAVLVDSPKPDPEVASAADQAALGGLPYFVHVSPRQIVDWKLDADGVFEWVRIEEQVTDAPTPFATPEQKTQWRIWTRHEWMVVDEEGAVIDGGAHPLGVVPMVVVRFEPPEEDDYANDLAGVSFMDDFARINRMLANKTSEVDVFLTKNMLQILTLSVSVLSQMGTTGDEQMTLKDGGIIEFPQDGKEPSFIAPDVSGAEQAFAHIQSLRWEMFRIATQKDVRAEGSVSQESGLSKMVEFEEQNAVLSGMADGLQVAEQQATELWFKWQGQEAAAAEEIDYPDNFNLRSLQEDMAVALNVRDVFGTASPTFLATYLFELVRRITDDLTDEEARVIQDELLANLNNAQDQVAALGRVGTESESGSPFATDDDDEDAEEEHIV